MSEWLYTPDQERMLHRSISPLIVINTTDDAEIEEMIRQGLQIEEVTRGIAKGDHSLWEAMELLEAFGYPMDQWTEEICINLEQEFGMYYEQ